MVPYYWRAKPTQRKDYELQIQNNKGFKSFNINEHHYVGEIDEKDQKKLKAYENQGHWYKIPHEIDDIVDFITSRVGWEVATNETSARS